MHFAFNDDQLAIRSVARRFLSTHQGPTAVLARMGAHGGAAESQLHNDAAHLDAAHLDATSDDGSEALWKRLSEELGWPAIAVPEDDGGLGMGLVDLVAVIEECGRAMLWAPLLSHVFAELLLVGCTGAAGREKYGAMMAEGAAIGTIAAAGASGHWSAQGTDLRIDEAGRLTGKAYGVTDAESATHFFAIARNADDVPVVRVVCKADEGVSIQTPICLDATRSMSTLTFDCAAAAGQTFETSDEDLERFFDRAAVVLAAEQIGMADACLDAAVEYAKTRTQFGRAIGSFQAIKHMCADLLMAVETGRSAVYYAAWAADHADEIRDADAPNDEAVRRNLTAAIAASIAQSAASETCFQCAGQSIQIHGGIGFTWEHEAHLYFKRARLNATLLGDAQWHREKLALRANFDGADHV